jgi:predicted metalloprotease
MKNKSIFIHPTVNEVEKLVEGVPSVTRGELRRLRVKTLSPRRLEIRANNGLLLAVMKLNRIIDLFDSEHKKVLLKTFL